MAPKRRGALEQVQRMYQQADEANLKLDYKIICQVTKNNPTAIRSVKSCLVSLGMWTVPQPSAPEPAAPSASALPMLPALPAPQQLALTDGSEVGALPAADGSQTNSPPTAAQAFSDKNLKETIHRNYNTWSAIPVVYWKFWLSQSEPIAFSVNNLKSLLQKGQREILKGSLMQLAEYVYGLDLESLVGDERNTTIVSVMLKNMAEERGNLGNNLVLPVDWSTHGYYTASVVNGELVVQHRFSGSSGTVPGFVALAAPPIEVNWSERRAYMKIGAGVASKTVFCAEVVRATFPCVMTPTPKKRRQQSPSGHARNPSSPATVVAAPVSAGAAPGASPSDGRRTPGGESSAPATVPGNQAFGTATPTGPDGASHNVSIESARNGSGSEASFVPPPPPPAP